MQLIQHLGSLWFYRYLISFDVIFVCGSPPTSPRSLYSHPGAAQPVSASAAPESPKKYTNPATIPGTFSTTVDSRGSNSNLSSRSSSQSSLSLASSLSPQQAGTLNVGRLEPLIQAPSESSDASSELFSPTTWHYVVCAFIAFYIAYRTLSWGKNGTAKGFSSGYGYVYFHATLYGIIWLSWNCCVTWKDGVMRQQLMAAMGAINVPPPPPPAEKTELKKFCRGVRGGLHVGYLLKSNFIVLQLLRDEEGWRDKAD